MIRRLFCILAALILTFTLTANAQTTPDLVRLHILADSNSQNAQKLKLEIRDAILPTARLLLKDCPDPTAAYNALTQNLPLIETIAENRARTLGSSAEIHAETGVFPFPDRTYGNTTVPAGAYRALRITIGSGQGNNWWCILFPDLCIETDGHSFLLDWLKSKFGGETP